jgi:hypothetical protein
MFLLHSPGGFAYDIFKLIFGLAAAGQLREARRWRDGFESCVPGDDFDRGTASVYMTNFRKMRKYYVCVLKEKHSFLMPIEFSFFEVELKEGVPACRDSFYQVINHGRVEKTGEVVAWSLMDER